MRGMAWRAVEREEFVTGHRDAIDLAFSLEQDTWNGERYLQLSVADFKAPTAPAAPALPAPPASASEPTA